MTLTFFFLAFQGFGQVRDISRAPNGCLYVDFKKASVAETVCLVSLILGFRFCVSGFGFWALRLSFFGSGIALGVAWWWWVDDKVEYATSPVTYFKLSRAFTPFFPWST